MARKSNNTKARYRTGLNDFEYCASLNVFHPNIEPDVITQSLQLHPEVVHCVGDRRCTPSGAILSGAWESTYWTAELEVRDDEDIPTFLTRLSQSLEPAAIFLQGIVDDGGRIECFLGIFSFALCDQVFSSQQLAALGQLGVDLRLDYYPSGEGQ